MIVIPSRANYQGEADIVSAFSFSSFYFLSNDKLQILLIKKVSTVRSSYCRNFLLINELLLTLHVLLNHPK